MKPDLYYVLPHSNYFTKGVGGAVSHAIGILSGFIINKKDIRMIAEPFNFNQVKELDMEKLFDSCSYNIFSSSNKIKNRYKLIRFIDQNSNSKFIIRKDLLFFILYALLSQKKANVIWEINGLSLEKYENHKVYGYIFVVMVLINKFVLKKSKGRAYVISDKLKQIFSTGSFRICQEKIVSIPNGGHEPFPIKKIEKNSKDITLLFYGKFQYYNDFQLLISSYKVMKKKMKNLRLIFVGFGPEKNNLLKLIEQEQDDKIAVIGPYNLKEVFEQIVLNRKVIGLIPMIDSDSLRYTSPIKLYDYASLNIPIIASSSTSIHSSDKSGFIRQYEVNKPHSLIETLTELINSIDNNNYENYQQLAHNFSRDNSWSKKMSHLGEFIFQK